MLNIENLKRLAKLAKIEIEKGDEERILNLINNDIGGVKAIDEINVDGLEPLINPYDMELKTFEDKVSDGDEVDELMNCAPKSMYNYFVVPKVVE